jgi:hypothetical protein
MSGLLSTRASRAWTGVVAVGVVVVALVIGLQLIPRLGAGQQVVDAASPAMTDEAVAGEIAATRLVSQYVALADPLMTRKGETDAQTRTLVRMIARRTGVSTERARAFLRREAPHTDALLRSLPFTGIARERRQLTQTLSTTLNTTPDDLQDQLARGFPRLYQTLAELPSVTSGWRAVPGAEQMTRFDGSPATTMRGVRDYLRDALVATVAAQQDRFQALAGSGGIGYVPYLLLVVGLVAIVFGLVHARWSAVHASGRVAWGAVVALGVLIMLLVGALQYVPRLDGAGRMLSAFEPAFDEQRLGGLRAGSDFVEQAVRFGDPIMTPEGGATAELPMLVTFVAGRAGLTERQVRARLQKAAPRTMALLEAIPLSAVAQEVPHLVAVLSRKLGVGGDRLVRTLRRRTPGLARALLAVGPVTAGWNRIPGTDGLERFDGLAPVRSAPEFAEYLGGDVVALFEAQRSHFETLADTWPRVDVLSWLVLGIGALLAIYATAMLFLATPRRRR